MARGCEEKVLISGTESLTDSPSSAGIGKSRGWRAALDLGYVPGKSRTILVRRRHTGPLMVQRPFYPEGGTAHTYILHPPGGVVGGDELRIDVSVARGSSALITTPASAKLYRSIGPQAALHNRLQVERDSTLEWLPQPTIVFDGARAQTSTRVALERGARYMGWEAWTLGRPACDERFTHGRLHTNLQLSVEGRAIVIERQRIRCQDPLLGAMTGLAGQSSFATMLVYPAQPSELQRARETLMSLVASTKYVSVEAMAPVHAGVSLLDGVLVGRFVGNDLQRIQRMLVEIWSVLRPMVMGAKACMPRVWAT